MKKNLCTLLAALLALTLILSAVPALAELVCPSCHKSQYDPPEISNVKNAGKFSNPVMLRGAGGYVQSRYNLYRTYKVDSLQFRE